MSGRSALSGTLKQAFAPRPGTVEASSLHALAVLLLLVQVPHVMHLPFWVSALGAAIVALRLLELHRPAHPLRAALLSPLVLTLLAALAGLAIRLHYGYFIGRNPGVAFLSVLVAAKFAEIRRSGDATLLLCLASFLLLTQYFYSQSILAALLTLPAVLALGNALAVLRDPTGAGKAIAHLRTVVLLLLQGLPIAALLFLVFPRLPGPLWSLPDDSTATTGLSDSMEPGSIGELSQSDAVAFRVEFDPGANGAVPPPSQRYWRGPVLEAFDGRRWSVATPHHEARPPTLDATERATRLDYTVLLEPHNQHWLFALDNAVSLPRSSDATDGSARVLARLTDDGQLIAPEPIERLTRYHQRSLPSATLASSRAPSADTLALPGRNPRSAALAARLHAQHPDPRAYAAAVMARFNREPYRYTLSPSLLGDAPTDEFLFDTRAGFCEHYAAAFVVLMRAAGIPARVVTGYLGGEMNGDYMIVRQSDAHAWAEIRLDGAWHRYDPTGAVAPSRVESGLSAALPDSGRVPRLARAGNGWLKRAGLRWDAIEHGWQRRVIDFDDDSQDALLERLGLPDLALWQIVTATLTVVGLWSLVVLRLPGRRAHRHLPPEERLWLRFMSALARRGVVREPTESPGEYIARAANRLPRESARIERIGQTLITLRFARPDPNTATARLAATRAELRTFTLAGLAPGSRRARTPNATLASTARDNG